MTTEEMDIVIAKYMGYTQYKETRLYENYDNPICGQTGLMVDDMEFCGSWSHLMPVWQKLRGELVEYMVRLQNEINVDWDLNMSIVNLMAKIEKAIAQDTDNTTAHRLMVEAIELIKK